MATTTDKLKYLFVAEYSDNTFFIQPEDDKFSKHDDKAEHNPSSYADIDQKRLVKFHLAGRQGEDLPTYSVDLRDGHFEIDGVPFIAHDQFDEPKNLKLIYFREVALQTEVDKNLNTVSQKHFVNRYFIGWETPGKNKIRRTIGVK